MKSSLKLRIITAVICVPLLILVLLSPKPVVTIVVMAAALVGLYEYYNAVGLSKHKNICIMGYLASLVISMGANFSTAISIILVFLYVMALFVLMLLSNKSITIVHLSTLIFGLIYIPYFLSHIIYIRSMDYGNFFIWLVFIGAFSADTCAYFTGKLLGKHKLCPNISPNKTVEGAIGGILGGGITFVIFGLIVNSFFGNMLCGMHFDILRLFILGLTTALFSEIGDLVASSIKRQFNIKDFGNVLPGHGGILDRCDSIIIVAPTIFLFLYTVPVLV